MKFGVWSDISNGKMVGRISKGFLIREVRTVRARPEIRMKKKGVDYCRGRRQEAEEEEWESNAGSWEA